MLLPSIRAVTESSRATTVDLILFTLAFLTSVALVRSPAISSLPPTTPHHVRDFTHLRAIVLSSLTAMIAITTLVLAWVREISLDALAAITAALAPALLSIPTSDLESAFLSFRIASRPSLRPPNNDFTYAKVFVHDNRLIIRRLPLPKQTLLRAWLHLPKFRTAKHFDADLEAGNVSDSPSASESFEEDALRHDRPSTKVQYDGTRIGHSSHFVELRDLVSGPMSWWWEAISASTFRLLDQPSFSKISGEQRILNALCAVSDIMSIGDLVLHYREDLVRDRLSRMNKAISAAPGLLCNAIISELGLEGWGPIDHELIDHEIAYIPQINLRSARGYGAILLLLADRSLMFSDIADIRKVNFQQHLEPLHGPVESTAISLSEDPFSGNQRGRNIGLLLFSFGIYGRQPVPRRISGQEVLRLVLAQHYKSKKRFHSQVASFVDAWLSDWGFGKYVKGIQENGLTHVEDGHGTDEEITPSIPTSPVNENYMTTIGKRTPEPTENVSDEITRIIVPPSSDGPLDRHNSSRPVGEGFRRVMEEIASEKRIKLSEKDWELFASLKDVDSFVYNDCALQFTTSGLCVEIPKGAAMPKRRADVLFFHYGPSKRKVCLVPEQLSALGFSVLSWILVPGIPDSVPLIAVMERVTFRNCFVERVLHDNGNQSERGTEMTEEGNRESVVVPTSWLYWLGLEEDFAKLHGETGDRATELRRGRKGIFRKPRTISDRVLSRAAGTSCKDESGGFLLLKSIGEKRRLLHLGPILDNNERTGFSLGFGIPLGQIQYGRSRKPTVQREQTETLIDEGNVRIFESLENFLVVDIDSPQEGQVISRMRWFQRVIEFHKVVPSGTNRGFLKAMMLSVSELGISIPSSSSDAYWDCQYVPVDMFNVKDCRVRGGAIRHHKVYQNNNHEPDLIYFDEDVEPNTSHGRIFAAPVERRGGPLLYINKLISVERPAQLESFAKLSFHMGGMENEVI